MPFEDDCRDADYRRDPGRPKKRPPTDQCAVGAENSHKAPGVRLVGPEREAFLSEPALTSHRRLDCPEGRTSFC
jgi:hypothetical protein